MNSVPDSCLYNKHVLIMIFEIKSFKGLPPKDLEIKQGICNT